MNKQKSDYFSLVIILTFSFTAAASDVYKRVNEDGIVEFSDRPTPDADKIDVKPNVVETNPVTRRTPDVSSTDSSSPGASASSRQLNSTNNEYVRTTNRREREARQENREEENRDEIVADPDPGRATRNAVRAGAGARPR